MAAAAAAPLVEEEEVAEGHGWDSLNDAPSGGDGESSPEGTSSPDESSTSPRRVRVAAKPFTRPFAFRRDAPLTRRSPSPGSPAAECGEAEEVQAKMRARKLAEGFEREDERWALDVDVDGV